MPCSRTIRDLACRHQRQNRQHIQSERAPFSLALLADRVFDSDNNGTGPRESCEDMREFLPKRVRLSLHLRVPECTPLRPATQGRTVAYSRTRGTFIANLPS